MELCHKRHEIHCNHPIQYIENMKLLDCWTMEITECKAAMPYVVLSYVWGGRTKGQDWDYKKSSITLESLPKTLQDSVKLTRLLGYQYIWIDQICIDQTQVTEKHQQIQQMDKIYNGAELTIIAAAGEDAECGLPGISSSRAHSNSTIDFGHAKIFPITIPPDRECAESKWTQRGWTLQEGYLSRRRIFITETQATFECRECTIPESLCARAPSSWYPSADETKSRVLLSTRWPMMTSGKYFTALHYFQLILSFSSRSLSYDSDSFSAFAEIAAYFNKQHPPIPNLHRVPLPIHDDAIKFDLNKAVALGLSWSHTDSGMQPENLKTKGEPYRRAEFPSWTWVGWCGRMEVDRHFTEGGAIDSLLTLRAGVPVRFCSDT